MPGHLYGQSPALILVSKCEIMHQSFVTTALMGLGIAETYLSIYTASPSLLSIMCRAAWGGEKPEHMSASPGYACETTTTRRRQPNHIHSDWFCPYGYFVPGWTQTRTEEVCSSVVKYNASTELANSALKCQVLTSAFRAQTGRSNFTFNCRDLSWALTRHKTVPAVPGIYPGFAKRKVNIPAIPWPCRDSYKWLVHYFCRFGHGMESKACGSVTMPRS